MKKTIQFTIKENNALTSDIYKMVLTGSEDFECLPGQFVNVDVPGFYLRRPISVCDQIGRDLMLIYKTVGKGTKELSSLNEGMELSVLLPLGNGYDLEKTGDRVVLVGGGVGVPPMYYLARKCLSMGKDVAVVLGFQSAKNAFYVEEFEKLGAKVYVCSDDGSLGMKGFVSDVIRAEKLDDRFYMACGPLPMLKAVYNVSKAQGQMSFEERMGCGFGACMGCSHKTKKGNKRVCVEGPVFESEEIIWEEWM